MTIGEVLGVVRGRLKEHSSDSYFTDQQLYTELMLQRASVLRVVKGKMKLSEWDVSEYCVALEKAKSHDCSCVQHGCDVLKTLDKLPVPITGTLQVKTLSHKQIGGVTADKIKYEKDHPYLANKLRYSIINQKLVLWNTLDLKAVIVSAVWEDPTDWVGVDLCSSDGNVYCQTDIDTLSFGLTTDLIELTISATIQKLVQPTIPQDVTNDSQPEKRI